MSDQAEATTSGKATRQDLVDQNFERVFPQGFAADDPEQQEAGATALVEQARSTPAPRPAFGVSAVEIDAAKMMASSAPIVPQWLAGNPGQCWAIIQLSKRWTKFDARTNSWVHFDPITIAQAMYLVTPENGKPQTTAFMSVFIRALVEAFAPLKGRLRYEYTGEGPERCVRVSGHFAGEEKPHEYVSPPISRITPKRSPLWSSDPDRQLAYYGSRAWGRLYIPAVLNGVYDADELDADVSSGRGPDRAKDVTAATQLHERLAKAAAENGDRQQEGYREGVVEHGLNGQDEESPGKAAGKPKAAKAAKPQDAPNRPAGGPAKGKAARSAGAGASGTVADAGKEPKKVRPPRNPAEYEAFVAGWLVEYDDEAKIEERWRSERGLRNACSVVEEDRKDIRARHVEPRIQEIRQ